MYCLIIASVLLYSNLNDLKEYGAVTHVFKVRSVVDA